MPKGKERDSRPAYSEALHDEANTENKQRDQAEAILAASQGSSISNLENQVAGLAGLAGPEGMAVGAVLSADAQKRQAKEAAKAAKRAAKAARGPGAIRRSFDWMWNAGATAVDTVHAGWAAWAFALFALAAHVWDFANGFGLQQNHRIIMLIWYILIAIIAIFFYYKTNFSQESGRYLGLSLIAFALPYARWIPYIGTNDYFNWAMMFLPLWFLYIALHEHENSFWLPLVAKGIILGLILTMIIVLVSLVIQRDLLPNVQNPAGAVGASIQRVWQEIVDAWHLLWGKITGSGVFSYRRWEQKFNSTFNPSAVIYAGQVEQNKQEPIGVYITNLKSLYPNNYRGTEPVITSRIEAKTFIPGGVLIEPSCRLERTGKQPLGGITDVKEILVEYQMTRDVACTFPIEDNITLGTWYGVMGAKFPFETWAYITNTFVARSTIRNYQAQGRDINRDLDIDQQAVAVYTNGPVGIGISSGQQPIDIDPDAKDNNYIQQRFGFTLTNRWTQGQLGEVREVDLLIAEPFQLKEGSCLPTAWSGSPTLDEDGFWHYTFQRSPDLQIDARHDYRTVTCQLMLPDKESAEQVLGFGEKTPVTFVVIAKYDYVLEKKVAVKIGE